MTGITVKQYNTSYDPQINKHQKMVVKKVSHGWEVTFARTRISEIFCEEYERDSWFENAGEGDKRSFYVIRFLCTGPPESRDCTEYPRPPTVSQTAGAGEAIDSAQKSDKSSGFPLARLCADPHALVGMHIRLAFEKPVRTPGQGPGINKRTDMWVWPLVVNVLVGSAWRVVDDAESKATLNIWAEANKDRLDAVRLQEVGTGDQVEWRLERKW